MINTFKKDFLWNSVGTMFSSFNSLFFLVIITRINGVNDAGIFSFAFAASTVFYVIGVYSGRTYQIVDTRGKLSNAEYFYSRLLTCALMLFVALFFCWIRGYDLYKSTIIIFLTLYKLLEAWSEYSYAIIQKHNRLYKVGQSLLLKAASSLILFCVIDLLTKNVVLTSLMIIIGNLAFIIVFDLKSLRSLGWKKDKCDWKAVGRTFYTGFWAFGFNFMNLYVINAQRYSIDSLMSEKDQAIFGIIIMPATVLILIAQLMIQPFLIRMQKSAYTSRKKFVSLVFILCTLVTGIGAFIIGITYYLGIPFLQLLYGLNLENNLSNLMLIMLGAVLFGIVNILSTALIIMHSTGIQFGVLAVASLTTLILSQIFVHQAGLRGASWAYSITMLLLLVLYIFSFSWKVRRFSRNALNQKQEYS